MNSVARSGVFAPRRLGRSHVPRLKLVSSISLHLERDGFLAMCCEPGMGCKTLVCDVAASLEARGFSTACAVIDVEFVEASLRSARRTAKALIAGCARKNGSYALDSSDETFLAIECPGLLDDCYLARVCSIVTLALASGCWVLLLLHPDAEYILEILPACHVMRSDELCVGMDEFPLWVGLLGSFDERTVACATHGIPLLMASLGSAGVGADGLPYGPSWDRSVCGIVEEALRPSLIYEELCMRGAMLALESGSFEDLEALGLRVTRDLIADTARSAPIFGISSGLSHFSVVPCGEDCLVRLAIRLAPGSPRFWGAVAMLLAERGDLTRAGAVASASGSESALRDLALTYPVELIDAGLVRLVDEAVKPHKGLGPAFDLARRALVLVGTKGWARAAWQETAQDAEEGGGEEGPPESSRRLLTRLQVELLSACRRASSGEAAEILAAGSAEEALVREAEASGSRVAQAIAAHLQALALWLSGSSLEAFRTLMLARELRGQRPGVPSVFSALLQLDFEALRCLVGDPSSAAEQTGLACAEAVLERGGLPALGDGARLRREMAYAMAGEGWGFTDLGRVMGRQGDVGETAELAVLHLVASLSDAADGSFQQANVHAWEAFRRAAENGMDDIACLATMAERIALDGLGEGHRAAALVHEGVEGIASDVQALVSLHASLGRSGKRETGELTEQMRRVSPRVGLAALAAFVVRADRVRGAMLARALPGAWRVRLDSDAPQEGMGTRPRALPAPRESRASQTVIPPLEVCVLGGLTLTMGERRITEKGWRRKTARSLMALLALTPGHVVTRFEAIEFLWPEADYDRGRENLYSTLSSLRQTIGQVSGEASYLITEMGQIWLDETLVTCDVDGFEELARSVVGGSLRDDEVVAACLRMDGAFRGGACAPPVDPHGRLRARCDELMRRYVDVLLVGAEAALRLRDVRQAVWFAESASAAASTREDVVACLARARGAVDDAKRGPAPEPSDDL